MLVEFKLSKYQQLLNTRRDWSKWTCTCPDFVFRQAEQGKCKHIKEIESKLDSKLVNKMKSKMGLMLGKRKLTENQKEILRELAEFKCEGCRQHEETVGKLEIHRIIRGNVGGTYIPRNIKILCKSCHKIMHEGEFG